MRIPKVGGTIPHAVEGHYGAGHVFLKPASAGTGVIAGAGVRAVLELGGVKDILSKCIGTRTPINMVRATVDAIEQLRMPAEIAALRGKTVHEVLGARLAWSAETGHVGVTAQQWADQEGGALVEASAAEVAGRQGARGRAGRYDGAVAEPEADADAIEADGSRGAAADEATERYPAAEPTQTTEDA